MFGVLFIERHEKLLVLFHSNLGVDNSSLRNRFQTNNFSSSWSVSLRKTFYNSRFLKIWWSALIGGLTVLIMYFTANSCKPDSCPDDLECRSLNGLGNFVCDPIPTTTIPPEVCEANPCCESGPTPLCCQNGVCSNDNFVFNATTNNANECQCLCTDNFSGLFKIWTI